MLYSGIERWLMSNAYWWTLMKYLTPYMNVFSTQARRCIMIILMSKSIFWNTYHDIFSYSENIHHCSHKSQKSPLSDQRWSMHQQRGTLTLCMCNTTKFEQVQCSSGHLVTGDYDRTSSVSAILQSLDWSSLQSRLKSWLYMLYKISSGLVDIPWNMYLNYTIFIFN